MKGGACAHRALVLLAENLHHHLQLVCRHTLGVEAVLAGAGAGANASTGTGPGSNTACVHAWVVHARCPRKMPCQAKPGQPCHATRARARLRPGCFPPHSMTIHRRSGATKLFCLCACFAATWTSTWTLMPRCGGMTGMTVMRSPGAPGQFGCGPPTLSVPMWPPGPSSSSTSAAGRAAVALS